MSSFANISKISPRMYFIKISCFILSEKKANPITLVAQRSHNILTFILCNGTSCISLRLYAHQYLLLHDSLSNLILKISYQWIVFTTAHCITKPVTKSYFHNKYFRGHASKCVSPSSNVSAEHAKSAVAFSFKRNLFEICSPVNMLIFPEKLGHRETTCKFSTLRRRIPSIYIYIYIYTYTGCPRRKGQNFGRVFLRLNYTDITQNTYIQS
jgi:hypothetical protein